MNKKRWIIICVSILLACVSSVSADETWEIQYNLTDLPITDTTSFNFSLVPNATISFNLIQNNSKTNLIFPDNITLPHNESLATLDINYTIPFLVEYDGNYSVLEDVVAVTNSLNSNLILLTLRFYIDHSPLIENQTHKNATWMKVTDDGKKVQIRTFTQVEFNKTHKVTVQGENESIVYTECGQFITCPNNLTIKTGEVTFDAEIYIPKNTAIGNYSSYINVTSGNNTGSIDFEIWVETDDDIYNLIVYDVFDPECFENPEKLAECYKRQAQYNAEIAQAMLDRLATCNITLENDTQVIERVKYVEVGNIDPSLLEDYNSLRAQYSELSGNYQSMVKKHEGLLVENKELRTQVNDEMETMSNEFILKRSNLEKEYDSKLDEAGDKTRRTISWFLGSMTLILILSMGVGIYLENNWYIKEFPIKILFWTTVVFLASWIIFSWFLR